MRITLVYPKLGGQINRAFRLLTGSYDPPLGILYLAGFLRKHGIYADLIDLSFSADWSEYRTQLEHSRPEVVGISCMSPFSEQARTAASIAKTCMPGCKVIMGGPHPTAAPRETIQNPDVDFVAFGEGEMTLLELLRALDSGGNLSQVNGLFYKEHGEVKQTAPRNFVANIDEIPFPARDILPTWQSYLHQIPFFPYINPYTTMMGGRGCPFNCSFCQPMLEKMFGRGVRLRSPANVADEAEFLIQQHRVRSVFFFDDTFTADAKWVGMVCDEFIRRRLDLVWGVNSRVNTFNNEMAVRLRKAGCVYVAFGVESGSQRVLNEVMHKGIRLEQVRQAFDICRNAGLISMASLMIGNPGESRDEVLQTISFAKDISPDIVDLHFTTPTPGSRMYELSREFQVASHNNRYQPGGLKLPGISVEDLRHFHALLQTEWRKGLKRRPYYREAACAYARRNFRQGTSFPVKYMFVLLMLASENVLVLNRLLSKLKGVYLGLYAVFKRP